MKTKAILTILAVLVAGLVGTTAFQISERSKDKKQFNDLKADYELTVVELESKVEQAKEASTQAKKLSNELDKSNSEIAAIKLQLEAKDEEVAKLKTNIEAVVKEKDTYKAGLEDLSKQLKTAQEQIASVNSSRDALKREMVKVESDRALAVQQLNTLKLENQKLRTELNSLINELTQMKQQVIKSSDMPTVNVEPKTNTNSEELSSLCEPLALVEKGDSVVKEAEKTIQEQPEVLSEAPDLAGIAMTLEATWASKYMYDGFDYFDNKAMVSTGLSVEFEGTGFSFGSIWYVPAASGVVDAEELDYWVSYQNSFFEGERFQTDYELTWVYYDYPKVNSGVYDEIDLIGTFSWPELLDNGVVPSYSLIYYTPAKSGGESRDIAGFIHRFGVDYAMNIPLDCEKTLPIDLGCSVYYNDGAGGADVDHDWSHVLCSAETEFDFAGGSLRPGIYYQISMDDSVNEENELWTGITYSLTF